MDRGREKQYGKEFLGSRCFVPSMALGNKQDYWRAREGKAMTFLLLACLLVWENRREIPKAYSLYLYHDVGGLDT